MTDAEWKATIRDHTNKELLKSIVYFSCDPYYYDLWRVAMNEIARRMGLKEKDRKEIGL